MESALDGGAAVEAVVVVPKPSAILEGNSEEMAVTGLEEGQVTLGTTPTSEELEGVHTSDTKVLHLPMWLIGKQR